MIEWIKEQYPDTMLVDGYDGCIIGICHRIGQEPIVAYSRRKILDQIMSEGCSELEAIEHYEFNQLVTWVGDTTPCYIETPEY